MRRVADWPLQLNAALEAARGRRFEWGVHDCALFAFGVVRDLTGQDLVAAYRGSYGNALGAARALKRIGTGHLRGSVGALLGTEIPVPMASRGDVVLWKQPGQGDTIGICAGVTGVFAGPQGLVHVDLRECAVAWRV